jgi:predicted nucleotidyltransferase
VLRVRQIGCPDFAGTMRHSSQQERKKQIMGIKQDQLDRVVTLAKAYGATRLILFGRAAVAPEQARDLDLACDGVSGWSLYALGARLEEELQIPLDLIPLTPPTRFTRIIEQQGKILL